MMPNTRCGSAWNSEELSRPSSMPTRPNRIPLAARANATGKPSNRKMISFTHSGRFARLRFTGDFFGQFLFGALGALAFARVAAAPHQEADAFDQVRHAGQHQQRETHGDQQLDRPADQAAGVGRMLVAQVRIHEHRPGQVHDQEAGRQLKEQHAEDLDPHLGAARQPRRDDVHAHVVVLQERVARRQQEHRAEHVPLHFQPGVGAEVEELAHDGVAGADQDDQQRHPGHDPAHPQVDRVYAARQGE
ncbi:hypothetical protein G6F68_012901 [Rhizopus microsporus]|nr:hypothetical protein G6F68_012901 [Rhizopus microsporus]